MGNSSKRAALLQHSTCRVRLPSRCYTLCLTFLILPSLSFAQLNHVEAAARLLSQGQTDQAEAEARQALEALIPRYGARKRNLVPELLLFPGQICERTHKR